MWTWLKAGGLLVGALVVILALGGPRTQTVTIADVEELWPLTVDRVTLRCHRPGAVTVEARGREYAVNGTARALGQWPDLDPIWRDDDRGLGYGPKVSVRELIDLGLNLCE